MTSPGQKHNSNYPQKQIPEYKNELWGYTSLNVEVCAGNSQTAPHTCKQACAAIHCPSIPCAPEYQSMAGQGMAYRQSRCFADHLFAAELAAVLAYKRLGHWGLPCTALLMPMLKKDT